MEKGREKAKISIGLEKKGNRVYVHGNTFTLRDRLKSLGCHWDGAAGQWWIGVARKADVERLVAEVNGQEVRENVDGYPVEGKVKYKGKIWYIIGSSFKSGVTHYRVDDGAMNGLRLHLTTLDGKLHFWTDGAQCEMIKTYQRGRDGKLKTLARLREFVEKMKNESPEERERREARRWAYEEFGGICRCARPRMGEEGECLSCGYGIVD